MKLTCPACGAVMSLDVLLANDGAREAVLMALQLPASLGKLLIQYLALFRPAKRQLSFDRVARLLEELKEPIQSARITRNSNIIAAPLAHWETALAEMLKKRDENRLTLPLTSHGYLFEILVGLSEKATAQAERTAEKRSKGHTTVGYVAPASTVTTTAATPEPRKRMPAQISDALNQFKQRSSAPDIKDDSE